MYKPVAVFRIKWWSQLDDYQRRERKLLGKQGIIPLFRGKMYT